MSENREAEPYSFQEIETIDFNPLEDFSFDDDIDDDDALESTLEDGPFSMPNPEAAQDFRKNFVSFANKETAQERIEALFEQMPTLQKMLFDILAFAQEPIASADLEHEITLLKEHHHSIYDPLTLCGLLEQAGALEKTDEAGASLESLVQEPLQVTIDGVLYWEVAPAPEIYWCMTSEGKEQYATYQPLEQIRACFEAEPQYENIFNTVLDMCARDGGSSVKLIGDVVDDEPEVQNPKRYAMYFIDKLERAGAVEWNGQWVITNYGQEYLASQNSTN